MAKIIKLCCEFLFGVTSFMIVHGWFVNSRVGDYLEVLGRKSRDKEETQRHRIAMGGQLSDY